MVRVIGLTGQSGAGKSEVSSMLEKNGIVCINCDAVSRDVTVKGAPALKAICEVFGGNILCPDGTLDRKKLGSLVFSDKEKLELLNKTIFPFIVDEIKKIIADFGGDGVIVLDAPTLFESGCDKLCGEKVAVVADREIRLKRIMSRDTLTKAEAENRINSQLSEEFFKQNCDVIIQNSGDLAELEKTVGDLLTRWGIV